MEIKELSAIAQEIKRVYEDLNRIKGKGVWSNVEYGQAFVGDAADLLKLLMMRKEAHLPARKELDKKIRHELADCLWSIVVIAQELNIDLEKEFLINMDYLKQKLSETVENL